MNMTVSIRAYLSGRLLLEQVMLRQVIIRAYLSGRTHKHLLELVLEGEVEGLGREVADDVCGVAAPEGPCPFQSAH